MLSSFDDIRGMVTSTVVHNAMKFESIAAIRALHSRFTKATEREHVLGLRLSLSLFSRPVPISFSLSQNPYPPPTRTKSYP